MEISGDVTDAGQTTNDEQGKIVLLSQWMLDGWISQFCPTKDLPTYQSALSCLIKRKDKSRRILLILRRRCQGSHLFYPPKMQRWAISLEHTCVPYTWKEYVERLLTSVWLLQHTCQSQIDKLRLLIPPPAKVKLFIALRHQHIQTAALCSSEILLRLSEYICHSPYWISNCQNCKYNFS